MRPCAARDTQERTNNPRKALDRASRLVPAIDARLVARAGHILAMEEPDTVDAKIVAFLSKLHDGTEEFP